MLSVIPANAGENGDRTIIYVAGNGSDSNDGSRESPFATLSKARDVVRDLNASGKIAAKGAVVYLRGGTYSVTRSLTLGAEDSGKEGAPVVYRAYPNEDVKIVGGAEVKSDELEKVNDKSVLAKLLNSGAANNLYRISFAEAGIDPDSRFLYFPQNRGVLTGLMNAAASEKTAEYPPELREKLNIPALRSTPLRVMVGDEIYDSARFPDKGYMHISKPVSQFGMVIPSLSSASGKTLTEENDLAAERYKEQVEGTPAVLPSFTTDQNDKIKLWSGRDMTNVFLSGNLTFGWSTECCLLKDVSPDGTINLAHATYWEPLGKGDPLYVFNFFDEITAGEYYIDTKDQFLYLCLDKTPQQAGNIKISLLEEPIIDIKNASWIDIKDLHFDFSAGEAVSAVESEHIVVDGCEFSNTMKQNRAVYMNNVFFSGVKNSYFHNVNGGITLYGGKAFEMGNSFIQNCTFEEFSEINKNYTPSFLLEGYGNTAKCNKIFGSDHEGVSFGGFFNTIEFNEIYNVCRNTDDAAAIYAGQSWVPRGNVLAYNYIHDLGSSSGGANMGIEGIYLDDGYSRADVVGNVLENIPNYGIFLGGGNGNGVYNNIIINSGGGIWCDERCYDTNGASYKDRLTNYRAWGDSFKTELAKKLVPDLAELNFDLMRVPANTYEDNIMYNSAGMTMTTLAQKYGTFSENIVTNEDPGFKNLADRDYTLDENAKIRNKMDGFMPIPFSRMGRINERAEKRIASAAVMAIDSPNALINGEKRSIDENPAIVPKTVDGVTYLPIRFLAEANGYTTDYNGETQTASFSDGKTTIAVNISNGETVLNGEKSEQDLTVIVENDRAFLPMREISEALGKKVYWNERGFISVSDIDKLFSDENDDELIDYIYSRICAY